MANSTWAILVVLIVALVERGWCEAAGSKTSMHNLDSINHERKLYKDLMANYNKEIRPIKDMSATLNVTFGMTLVGLDEVDERRQVITFHTWLKQSWTDDQLKWNVSDYGNVYSMRIDSTKLWQPDIVLYGSRSKSSGNTIDPLALVYNTGYVLFIPSVKHESTCDFNLEKFPFDEQTCQLKFGSWTYDEAKVSTKLWEGKTEVEVDDFVAHNEWRLTGTSVEKKIKTYACCPHEKYGHIEVKLKIARHASGYCQIFLVPCVLLSLLMPVMFLLPTGSNEKTSLGVGILLGFVLLLEVLASMIPAISASAPVIAQYYIVNIALVCIALFLNTIITLMCLKNARSAGVPRLLKLLTIDVVGRILCVKSDYVPLGDMEPVGMKSLEENDNLDTESVRSDKRHIVGSPSRSAVVAQWRHVAMVFDRLFCLIFLVIVIVTAVVFVGKGYGSPV